MYAAMIKKMLKYALKYVFKIPEYEKQEYLFIF